MIAIENKKMEKGKLLAAFVAIAMVVCAIAVFAPSSDAADTETAAETEILSVTIGSGSPATYTYADLSSAINAVNTANADVKVTVLAGFTANVGTMGVNSAVLAFNNNNDVTITIDGNGKTITAFPSDSTNKGNVHVIQFSGVADYMVSNLVIDGNNGVSKTGINVWNDAGDTVGEVTLEKVTSINNGAAGLVINRSNVIANNMTITGNPWGAINVDNGGKLVINGNNDLGCGFQIWSEDANETTGGSIISGEAFDGYQYVWTKESENVDDGAIWFADGTITEDFTLAGGNGIEVPEGKTLTIASGVTVTIGSTEQSKGSFTAANGGAIVNNGTIELVAGGTITGSVRGDGEIVNESGSEPDKYPLMSDGYKYTATNGTVYYIYQTTPAGKTTVYQYGLTIAPIYYNNGEPIDDSILSVQPKDFTADGTNKLIFTSTVSNWCDPETKNTYTGNFTGGVDAGEYPNSIRFYATIQYGEQAQGNTLTKYLTLNILPLTYTVNSVKMEGWMEGAYEGQEPTFTVTDKDGNKIETGYTSSWELYTDATCTKPVEVTDYNELPAGTYHVKVTVTPDTNNYVLSENSDFVGTVVVTVHVDPTEIKFSPITAADSQQIFGISDSAYQKNIVFNDEGDNQLRVTGQLINLTSASETAKAITKVATSINTESKAGYYLVFTVEGVGFDITEADKGIIADIVAGTLNGMSCENIDPKLETQKFYYVAFIESLPADSEKAVVENTVGFQYTADRDGNGDAGTGKYSAVTYTVDLSYINLYGIVLIDEGKNDTYITYAKAGTWFQFPSGAGDGFTHWTTEADCAYNKRVFPTDAIFKVGPEYDNGDYMIEFTAQYGSTPVQPEEPAKNVTIAINADGTGVTVVIIGDNGYVPTGTVTIDFTFIDSEGIQDFDQKTVKYDATQAGTAVVYVDLSDQPDFTSIVLVSATYAADDVDAVSSGYMLFTPSVEATV